MVQVENEVGMIPEARTTAPLPARSFCPVPAELTNFLASHRESLAPELRKAWETHDPNRCNWPETFGSDSRLMSCSQPGRRTLHRRGRRAAGRPSTLCPLRQPALVRPGNCLDNIQRRPLPHLFDIWRAAAPAIDFLSRIFISQLCGVARQYALPDNSDVHPRDGQSGCLGNVGECSVRLWTAEFHGLLSVCAGISGGRRGANAGDAYDVIRQLTPLILENQGMGHMVGFRAAARFCGSVDLTPQQFTLGNYTFNVRFRELRRYHRSERRTRSSRSPRRRHHPNRHGRFLVAGIGMVVTFGTNGERDSLAGIASIRRKLRERRLDAGQRAERRRRQSGTLPAHARGEIHDSARSFVSLPLAPRGSFASAGQLAAQLMRTLRRVFARERRDTLVPQFDPPSEESKRHVENSPCVCCFLQCCCLRSLFSCLLSTNSPGFCSGFVSEARAAGRLSSQERGSGGAAGVFVQDAEGGDLHNT